MYALLITSDGDDSAFFSLILRRAGLAVTTDKDLTHAMQVWAERPADLVVLNLAHPSPAEQVQRVRAETQVPLVLIVPDLDIKQQVDLLELGADLVTSYTLHLKLFIAQIKVVMRRAASTPTFVLPFMRTEDFTLNTTARTLEYANQPSRRLTHLEFRLLYALMTNRGQVMTTDTIVERVWGYTGEGDRDLVRGLVRRLRSKIEANPHQPIYIKTVPGIGYIFEDSST